MQQVLSDIRSVAGNIDSLLADVIASCGELNLDLTKATSTSGASAQMLFSQVGVLTEGSSNIASMTPEKLALVPSSRLQGLLNSLSNIRDALTSTDTLLTSVGEPQNYDASTGVLSGSGNNANIRAHLDTLQSSTDGALDTYLFIAAATRPKGIGTFTAASHALGQKAAEASNLVAHLQQQVEELGQRSAQLEGQASSVVQTQGEAQRLTEEIEKVRRTAEENEQKILAAAASAEEARTKASSVDAQVQAYQDRFTAFEEALEGRETAVKRGQEKLEKLETSLKEKGQESDQLLEKAKKMLGGATIAGLSQTYHDKASGVNTQLTFARWAFYAAMLFLFLSVLVALNLTNFWGFLTGTVPQLPRPLPGTPAGTIAVETLASLGSRALVVLPSLLLAGFAAHRHSALFRLREEYSHKEALAVSVQGFKEQAPTYQEPIAAAVFQELLTNPAVSMDKAVSRKRKPNGFVQRLISPAVEEALSKLLELRDGALNH